ncbi:MAG: NPCBM/NEW2 domain-containing protein [Limisphaerales bacterium]
MFPAAALSIFRPRSGVMREQSPAWRFDVELPAGAKTISLVAMDAGDCSREDFANWVNASFVVGK